VSARYLAPGRLALGLALALAACGGGPERTPLVLYSPHGRDLLTLVEKTYETEHPEIDLRRLDMVSQEVYDRETEQAPLLLRHTSNAQRGFAVTSRDSEMQ
jgi:hypothetical protein